MNTQENSQQECPCCSGKSYEECCKPFHDGTLPENAMQLMRSRYAAYALHLPKYILKTTHPASPHYVTDTQTWTQEVSNFARNTKFNKLEVLDFKEFETTATVTFVAHLSQNEKDVTFTENSYFEKIKGKWFYRSGIQAEGSVPELITDDGIQFLPIAYYGNPILRKKAEPIDEITDDIINLIEDMEETMLACDGMGLAAPQVHHSIRLFIVRLPLDEEDGGMEAEETEVYINPKLSLPSDDTSVETEGCLSVPTVEVDVERPNEITIEYMNLEGTKITRRLTGLEARIIMHENDHINGVLQVDRANEQERQKLKPILDKLKTRIHDTF